MLWDELSQKAVNAPFHHQAMNRGQCEQELKQKHRSYEWRAECHYPYGLSWKEILSCLPPNLRLALQEAEVLYYGWSPYLKELNQYYCLISYTTSGWFMI